MRRHQDNEFLNIKVGIAILVIILILVLVIWKPFSSNEDTTLNKTTINTSQQKDVELDLVDDLVTQVTGTKLSDKGLCENYLFKDGDILKISDYEIKLEAIGDSSVKIDVDGEKAILSENEIESFDSGLKLEIKKGSIFYQGFQNEYNSVEILVGCDINENTKDKYVKEKGEKICDIIYNSCLEEFDI